MKKIIPFNKDIKFKTMIGEITSISLENDLVYNGTHSIGGDLTILGTYKMTEASQIEENFKHSIPVNITIDEKYATEGSTIDINDFYYEIINEEILRANIEVKVDGLEEIEAINVDEIIDHLNDDIKEDDTDDRMNDENNFFEDSAVIQSEIMMPEVIEEKVNIKDNLKSNILDENKESMKDNNSIFSGLTDTNETYTTYYVYIVKENDSLDSILTKYNITKDQLADYNMLDNIKQGDKLIIPTILNYE